MRSLQKWSSVWFFIFVIVGLGAGWMVVQQVRVTPSEAQVMPGTQTKPLLPPRLPGVSTPPPEIQALLNARKSMSQITRQKPTVQSLVEKIRLLPNGPQKIEEAIQRGARLPLSGSYTPSFSWTLTSENPTSASSAEFLHAYGAFVDGDRTRFWLENRSYPSPYWGTEVSKPAILFVVDIPIAGVYAVNVEASPGSSVASLKHWNGASYATVETWSDDMSGSYPTFLELDVDDHWFSWVAESGTAFVYEVNVFSLP